MNQDTVLITRADSGIGLALARRFAHHGHPLVLTAPPESGLETIAAELAGTYDVQVRAIAKDLVEEATAQEVSDELRAAGINLEILVINTRVGPPGKFWETSADGDVVVLRTNVEAVVRLTKQFLPAMVSRGHGRILNAVAIDPDPEVPLAVYHATRAFVLSLSESLSHELQDTAVTVTTLCPPTADTTSQSASKMEQVDSAGFERQRVLSLQDVARVAYDGVMRGDRLVIAGTTMEEKAAGRRPAVAAKRRSKRKPRGEATTE